MEHQIEHILNLLKPKKKEKEPKVTKKYFITKSKPKTKSK